MLNQVAIGIGDSPARQAEPDRDLIGLPSASTEHKPLSASPKADPGRARAREFEAITLV